MHRLGVKHRNSLMFLNIVAKRDGTITDAGGPRPRVRLRCLNASCRYERVIGAKRFWEETAWAMTVRLLDVRFD